MCAALSAPIALSVDWMIMNILAVRRKKTKRSLAVVAPAPDDDNVGGRLRWSNTAKKRIELASEEVRKAMTIMDMTMFDCTAMDDLDKLKVQMRSYREFLPMAEKKEFDGMCRTTRMRLTACVWLHLYGGLCSICLIFEFLCHMFLCPMDTLEAIPLKFVCYR
jgi:hypothetical protein